MDGDHETFAVISKGIGEELRDRRISKPVKLRHLPEYGSPPQLPRVHFEGFLGYAIDLIYFDEKMTQLRLKERLWYPILRETMVFNTSSNLLDYGRHNRRPYHAFSLDGHQRRGSVLEISGYRGGRSNSVLAFRALASGNLRDQLRQEMGELNRTIQKGEDDLHQQRALQQEILKQRSVVHQWETQLGASQRSPALFTPRSVTQDTFIPPSQAPPPPTSRVRRRHDMPSRPAKRGKR